MLLDLLFPRRCFGCGRWGAYFCSQCLNYLSLNHEPICPVCEKNSIGGFTHPGCLRAQSLDGLTTIFVYKGLIKKAIKKLKYRFVSDLAGDLVELFLSFGGEDKGFVSFCRKEPSLVPIPLHSRRKRWRGFNQAELLGEMIAANLEVDFLPDLLQRIRSTKPQTKLNAEQRRENIQGAFSLNKNSKFEIHNSEFILFDDVWTSGATLKEAAKVLKRNGARKVWGLTLAR